MKVVMLAQRVKLVNNLGEIASNWFTMFVDLVKTVNNRRFTASGVRHELTGSTDATVATTINVIAGNLGIVRLSLSFSCTNNANAKTAIITLGSTVIQTLTIAPSTSSQSAQILIIGRGASSQFTNAVSLSNCTGSGGIATTEDISVNNTITVSMQLGTITDTIALESWALEVEQS